MLTNRDLFFRHIAQTSEFPPAVEFISGEGSYLIGHDGKKYLDLISGISVSSYGHGNPEIKKAIVAQTEKHLHVMVYGEHIIPSQVELAKNLASFLPANLQTSYLTNSGAEAVEGAMKLAKRFTGRTQFISFRNSYHGSTQGALSICGNESLKSAYRPLLPGHRVIDFNNVDHLKFINKDIAAVFIEPIQGEAGVIVPEKGFMKLLREKCSSENVLLVMDEIQTGMGRTGTLFAFEQMNIVPDILLLGKAFGAGMPLGAFISSEKIMKVLSCNPALGHLTTSGGHPVSCAAANAGLKFLTGSGLIKSVFKKEELFREKLVHPQIKNVRGKGLLLSIEFDDPVLNKKVIESCMKRGVLTDWFLFADSCMRIAPPLTISEDEINLAANTIVEAVDEFVMR